MLKYHKMFSTIYFLIKPKISLPQQFLGQVLHLNGKVIESLKKTVSKPSIMNILNNILPQTKLF